MSGFASELLKPILTFLGIIATGLFTLWQAKIKNKAVLKAKNDEWDHLFKDVSEVLSILRNVCKEGGAARAVVLKMNNGGGSPDLRSPVYSSILYEAAADGEDYIQHVWQSRQADAQYLENMRRVKHAEGRSYVFSEYDFKGSSLEHVYKEEGVVSSQIAELAKGEKAYWYCSINFREEYKDLDHSKIIFCNQAIASLQGIFKQYENKK